MPRKNWLEAVPLLTKLLPKDTDHLFTARFQLIRDSEVQPTGIDALVSKVLIFKVVGQYTGVDLIIQAAGDRQCQIWK